MSTRSSGTRRRLPIAVIAAASLLAFVGIFAVWANRQLLNTDNWTETSRDLIEDDAIQGQVALFLVDELYSSESVQLRLQEALPPRLDPLAAPAAGALRQVAERGTGELLGRPRAQALWVEANRRAHRRFTDVVEGGGDAVSTEGGEVTLDLKEMLEQTAARSGVGERLSERLPEDAARITIMSSDELGLVQDAVRLLKAVAIVLVVLVLALLALAVYLARGRRREALRACGIGLTVAGVAVLAVRSLAGDAIVDSLADSDAVRPATEAAWTISTYLLAEAATATVIYGVVLLLAAWLAGPARLAVAARQKLAPYLREPAYAYGALAVIVLLVLAWSPTPATRRVLPALVLIGLLAAGVEALRRQTAREHPEAAA
jgi:hypothetical protein